MKIMAIDYGDSRTGLAVSDATGFLAGRTFLIKSRSQNEVVKRILTLAREEGVQELVLGHPINMNGTVGPRAEKCEALARRLEEAGELPVILWDERRTTVDAHRILGEQGVRSNRRKDKIDAVAATLILEGYLDWKRYQREQESAP